MKFTNEDYNSLLVAVETTNIDIKTTLQNYYDKGIGKEPLTRFCWDLFFASKWTKSDENRRKEYNNRHIETAMRSIIKQLVQMETEIS